MHLEAQEHTPYSLPRYSGNADVVWSLGPYVVLLVLWSAFAVKALCWTITRPYLGDISAISRRYDLAHGGLNVRVVSEQQREHLTHIAEISARSHLGVALLARYVRGSAEISPRSRRDLTSAWPFSHATCAAVPSSATVTSIIEASARRRICGIINDHKYIRKCIRRRICVMMIVIKEDLWDH